MNAYLNKVYSEILHFLKDNAATEEQLDKYLQNSHFSLEYTLADYLKDLEFLRMIEWEWDSEEWILTEGGKNAIR